jgi:hypothetical protein
MMGFQRRSTAQGKWWEACPTGAASALVQTATRTGAMQVQRTAATACQHMPAGANSGSGGWVVCCRVVLGGPSMRLCHGSPLSRLVDANSNRPPAVVPPSTWRVS